MGIQIGSITIYYYGIIIMLGALAAAGLAAYEAKRKGQSSDIVWDGLVWVLIAVSSVPVCGISSHPQPPWSKLDIRPCII